MSDGRHESNAGPGADSTGNSPTPPQASASPSSSDPPPSTSSQPNYELLRLIGRGAYGEVWLARDQIGVHRAVKVIFRESFDRDRPYEREYDGIRKFEPISRSHDNQVQILHVGRHDERGQFYYIMELADDQRTGQQIDPDCYEPKTIKSELKKSGRFPVKASLEIGAALAVALENLHQHGLIHRDLKPANIIFVNGVPKLADIGLVTDRDVSVSYVGTEGYIPPEGPSSAQADIYGLGKVLYEMATGRDRLEYPELPTDLEERPDREMLLELNAIIAKACARDPRHRYRTARNLFEDLVWVQRGKRLRRRWRRRGLTVAGWIGAAAAVVGLAALGAHYFWKAPAARTREATGNRQTAPDKRSPAEDQASSGPATPVSPVSRSSVAALRGAWPGQTEAPWTNSLGLVFVPVPGTKVRFCIWETRVQDYKVFVKAVSKEWPAASFEQGPTHPAVKVSWFAARWFCDWLTREERSRRWLEMDQKYRLPTDEEWSAAAGLEHEEGLSPSDKSERIKDLYPWGRSWPPPAVVGNYRTTGLKRTTPVGSFAPNRYGLYDLGGNVWEWCEDTFEAKGDTRVMRGASWYPDRPNFLLSSHRSQMAPRSTNNDSVGFRVVLTRGGEP